MRVLVVEDDRRLADLLVRGLTAEGFAVDVERNGTDGLWRAREHPYDVIVLDIMLPGLNGYRVCSELRDAGGAGLGLAIARRIAARHHGTLTATDSEDFKGIRFVATIPTGDPTPRPTTVPVQRTGDEVWVYVNGEIMPTHSCTPEPREAPKDELDPGLIFGEHLPVIAH